MKIVLNYAIETFKINQKKLSINKIAKAIGARPDWGTIPGNIEAINSKLTHAQPSIRFRRQVSGRYTEIVEEIDQKRPVIAWIDKKETLGDEVWHVVIVNGFDPDLRRIYYVDTLLQEEFWQKECETGHFMEKRLGLKGYLVKLIIGGTGQKTLINPGVI